MCVDVCERGGQNSTGNISVNSNLFGKTRNAYNDINSTNDPGSRVLDFQLRYSF